MKRNVLQVATCKTDTFKICTKFKLNSEIIMYEFSSFCCLFFGSYGILRKAKNIN